MNKEQLTLRIRNLLATAKGAQYVDGANELFAGIISVLSACYGPSSIQVQSFKETVKPRVIASHDTEVIQMCVGTLRSLNDEVEAGLITSLEQSITGGVLTDFTRLSHAALEEKNEGAKNVAAVLAAAAYEDTIRRMGINLAGLKGTEDLSDVITTLKDKGILQAPQLGIALSYLNFRNHALHANWDQIEKESVASVLGFVEQLLMKHFH